MTLYSVQALKEMKSTDPNHRKSSTVTIPLLQNSTAITTDTSTLQQTSDTQITFRG